MGLTRKGRAVAAFAGLAVACLAPGCGSDDGDGAGERETRVRIEIADSGPSQVRMRAPREVPAGPVEIELRNRGDTPHDAQLLRVDGDESENDVVGMLEAGDPDPKPRWLHPSGGVAPVPPGERATVRQVLAPGTYYVVDTQERQGTGGGALVNAAKGGLARIEVTGETSAELPPTDATIVAREYGYDVEGIVAGTNTVKFRNAGGEFHQAVAFRLEPGVDFRAARRAVLDRERETGWVPVDEPAGQATTVLEGGGELITELTFRPGRYLLLCFVSDRVGGGAQWHVGMRARVDVPPG